MFGLLISESLLMLRAEGSEQAINDLHIDFRAIEDVSPPVYQADTSLADSPCGHVQKRVYAHGMDYSQSTGLIKHY
jgi:hypothetical protein